MSKSKKSQQPPPEPIIPKPEKRVLRYDFSAIETHELSLVLANKTKELQSVTDEKKTVVSQYAAKMNEIKARLATLSNQVTDGYEMREIECAVEFHKPSQGMKTLTRSDGGEAIIEKMAPWEFNLFNQGSDVSDSEKKGLGNDSPFTEGAKDHSNGTEEGKTVLEEVEDSKVKKLKFEKPVVGPTDADPDADPDAMKRVAEWDHTKEDKPAAKDKGKKKGRQTPDNPSGS